MLLSAATSGSVFQVNTSTALFPSNSAVAMDTSGDSFVTWQSNSQVRSDYGMSAKQDMSTAPPTDLELIQQAAAEVATMQLRNTGDPRLDSGFNVTTSYALRLQPYFASYGMLGMLEADRATGTNTYRTAVGEWLEWCGRSTGLSRTALDDFDTGLPDRLLYVEVGGYVGLASVVKGDAVDSAAANYLLVLEAYRAAGGTVSSSMNEVAEEALATLADLRDDDGLVFGLRDLPAKYLQDNIEVGQGLIAAQDYFQARGDFTRAELSRTMASNLWASMPKFRDSANNRFHIALGPNDEVILADDTVGTFGLGALEMIASYFPLTDRQALWETVMSRYVPETTNAGVGVERFAAAAVELSDPSIGAGLLNQLRSEMPGWYGRSLNDEVYIFRFGLAILALRDATSELPDIKNAAPSLALQNTVTLLAENTSTTAATRVADIVMTDDALGTNTISLSGADAASFEIVGNALRLKAGVALDFETKTSFAVTVNVDDSTVGTTPEATANFTLTITDANEAPILGGAVANQAVIDTATISPFTTFTIIDPDTQAMSASVTILNGVFRGDFTAATTTGWTRTVLGNDIRYARTYPSAANNAGTIQAAVRAFIFQPRTNAIKPNTTEATAFTVTVSDGIVSPVSNSSATVITASVNDVPTIGGASSTVTVSDNATVNPFPNLTVSDVDFQEMLISVTILNGTVRGDFTNATVANGWVVRQVLGNNITYKRYFSPQANVGAAAQAAFRALVFQPRQNAITPGTTELTDFQVTVSDGVAPAVLGTNTRLTTTSVNEAPTIGGAAANQTMNSNQTKAVFSTLTVTDPDTQNMLARVTIPNGVNRGDFTTASTSGWMRSVSGSDIVYNRYFSPVANIGATVQTAIRALIFQPRTNVPIGTTETTGFTVFINDGLANTTNSTTTVTTTGVAPRPAASSQSEVAATFRDSDIKTVIVPTVSKTKASPLARLLKRMLTVPAVSQSGD